MNTTPAPVAQQQVPNQQLLVSPSRARTIIRGLSIAETVLGTLIVLLGITVAVIRNVESLCSLRYTYSYRYTYTICYYVSTTYEGIWCGIWVIVAGALGITAGKQGSTRCMILLHMSFAIVGSCFAIILVGMAGSFASGAGRVSSGTTAPFAILSVLAFAAFVIQIVSACYCCCTENQCCTNGNCCTGEQVAVQTIPVTYSQQTVPATVYVNQTVEPVSPAVQKPHYHPHASPAIGQPPSYVSH